uniref:Small ribosomal subunit protein bS6m n=1 Tax=Cyanoderma ruficeps TaxID=181631 RepID=A0A8C3NTU2_9PASS
MDTAPRAPGAFGQLPRARMGLLGCPETAAVLKRTVEALMEKGAVVRNLENLGERSLPYKISKHKESHKRGGDFKAHLVPSPAMGRDTSHCPRLLQAPVSSLALGTARDPGAATAALGTLCQGLTTFKTKNFFPISSNLT